MAGHQISFIHSFKEVADQIDTCPPVYPLTALVKVDKKWRLLKLSSLKRRTFAFSLIIKLLKWVMVMYVLHIMCKGTDIWGWFIQNMEGWCWWVEG